VAGARLDAPGDCSGASERGTGSGQESAECRCKCRCRCWASRMRNDEKATRRRREGVSVDVEGNVVEGMEPNISQDQDAASRKGVSDHGGAGPSEDFWMFKSNAQRPSHRISHGQRARCEMP